MDFKVYYNKTKTSILAGFQQDYVDKFIEKSDDDKITDMVFVIDKSGSMEDRFVSDKQSFGFSTSSQSKSQVVLSALTHSVDYLKILSKNNHKIRLSVISFDENSNLLLDKVMVEDTSVFDIAFNSIKQYLYPNGGTNIFKVLQFTKSHVDTILQTNSNIDNVNIFVMTDGYNNNKNDNVSMVEFFKSVPYRNRFIGMGIGNATDYDAELLDRLFIKLKGSPSAVELSDNISSDTFGACSTVLTNFKIVFEDFGSSEFYSPVNFEKKNDMITISLDRVDFSQKLIFSFDNKDEFATPIKMKVSYRNIIEEKDETHEILLNTGETDDTMNDRINTLTHIVHEFLEITKSPLSQKENQTKTQELLVKFSSWNKEDRTGDIGDMWTANENIVINHKKELDKYVDLQSYTAYSRVCSKQVEATVSVGLTPSLSRQASNNVHTKYHSGSGVSSKQQNTHHTPSSSAQIPEDIDFDASDYSGLTPTPSGNGNVWASPPDIKLTRQNACTVNLPDLIGPARSLSTLSEESTTYQGSTLSSVAKNLNNVWGLASVQNNLPTNLNLRSATSNPIGKEVDSNNYKPSSNLNL
jgi:hypothetical protein